ncbi:MULTISPECIES: NAD-dependent epimerase/dehydratase family protein [unclassified Pseudoalteromonas]|uniref:NAD-dependent epimerase/dehydratase family protein n=1 Tax=unclassified Pseudoalteromonas TaxID=194690 RepID=UPI002579B6C9|nr:MULTISPECIES: NAD-dependent epimerase/dehydratase family protein [unclassified Pseudoalteromonas]|tara:strand:- start:12378 stop:13286 length:909 start_codon:yes stop_codon:yes gene_type:complete
MNVLLTGATGFIGKYLQRRSSFRYVVRSSTEHLLEDVFEIPQLDSNTDWNNAFNGIDCVIHLAGLAHSNSFTDKDYQNVNVDGTLRLASEGAKAGVKRFIFVSSIGVNGYSTKKLPFSVNSVASPHNSYSKSKYDAEEGLKVISANTGMELVIIRPTLVYGPGAPGNFRALAKLVKKSPVLPFGLLDNERSFIAVQNLVDLLITCTKHPNAAGKTFIASDGPVVSIKDFTNAIAKGMGKKKLQLPVPLIAMRLIGKAFGKSAAIEQLLCNLEVDSSYVTQELGWKPPYTMEESMKSLKEVNK